MKNKVVCALLTAALIALVSGCGESNSRTLKVVTHDSFALPNDVVAAFEKDNNIRLEIAKQGDSGEALNKTILAKANPIGDVFYGVDNTYLTRALSADIFAPYASPRLAMVDPQYRIDKSDKLSPVDHGEVCVDYDKQWFQAKNLVPPKSFDDLTKPEYKNLAVIPSAATSSTGLAFLFGTIAANNSQASAWKQYWSSLKANGVSIVGGWDQAYNTSFSGGPGKGDRPIVISYSSSPPVAVADIQGQKPSESPIGVVPSTCFQQVEFVGILKSTKQRELAQKFVDFMLAKTTQDTIPENMYMYPVVNDATLPPAWAKYSVKIAAPLTLDPQWIADNRESVLSAWTEVTAK